MDDRIDISVLLPVRNGGALLEDTLRSIRSQKSRLRYEVLSIDSGSTDRSAEILKAFNVPVIPIDPGSFNHGLTRNRLAEMAKGRFLLFLNQDVRLCPADAFDRLAAAVLLAVVAPLIVLVTVLIKATSKGPVFFKQVRQGFRGKPFMLYKFRTMVSNAEQLRAELEVLNEMDEVVFKIERDPRITPLGRVLRKWSIDELPQIFNVLKGEMSLVGPRPMLHTEIEKFKYWQRRKLSVKPGLTCLWQISGRSNLRFEDWMRLDLEYIDNWSLMLDAKILLWTIPVVLVAKGAK